MYMGTNMASPYNARKNYRTDLNLGKVVYTSIIFYIPVSWLDLLNGYVFCFWWRDIATNHTKTSRAIVFFGTPLKSLQKTSKKTNVFEAFSRLHGAKGPNRAASALFRQRKSWEAAIFVYTQLTNHKPRILQICNTSFAARKVGHAREQQRISTCNATMLREKLKKNVARITGPLKCNPTCVRDNFGLFCSFSPKLPRTHVAWITGTSLCKWEKLTVKRAILT